MDARSSFRMVLLAAVAVVTPAWAGGGHGGAMFHPVAAIQGGGIRNGAAPFQTGVGGFPGAGRFRALPPVSGVIHERAGLRPYVSAYRHFNTATSAGGVGGPFGARYGHLGTALRPGLPGSLGWAAGRGFAAYRDRGRRPFGAGRFAGAYPGVYGGYGGGGGVYGGGSYGSGGYAGTDLGAPGAQGGYAGQGTYGTQGTYGSGAADQGMSYVSETPLSARFAEPPLAPNPYGGADSYAYAASEDVGYGVGPRIISVSHPSTPDCGCGDRTHAAPMIYRYGVGTAY